MRYQQHATWMMTAALCLASVPDASAVDEDWGMLAYSQPFAGLRYNAAWGTEVDGGLLLGYRDPEGLLYGIGPHAAWTEAGFRYGVAIGAGQLSNNGGMGSLVLRYCLYEADDTRDEVVDGVDYEGIDMSIGSLSNEMAFSLSVGYYRNVDDDEDEFFAASVGVGF